MRRLLLAPSILAADFNVLGANLAQAAEAGAAYAHIDVMDGRFVPGISVGDCVLESLTKNPALSNLTFDVHLMTENPAAHAEIFARAGADIIGFHVEAVEALGVSRTIGVVRGLGKRVSLTLSPQTPVVEILPFLKDVDMVLVMSVEPGLGGQAFLPHALGKAREIRRYADANGLNLDIEMDGGITLENARAVVESGVNVVVAGTAVFRQPSIYEAVRGFLRIFEECGGIR